MEAWRCVRRGYGRCVVGRGRSVGPGGGRDEGGAARGGGGQPERTGAGRGGLGDERAGRGVRAVVRPIEPPEISRDKETGT